MAEAAPLDGSRRERQVLEILWRLGEATAADVRAVLPDPPTYSAVRSTLRLLVEKERVTTSRAGRALVYRPASSPVQARRSAARSLLRTFFGGSVENAVAALLDASSKRLSDEALVRLRRLIDDARAKGGTP